MRGRLILAVASCLLGIPPAAAKGTIVVDSDVIADAAWRSAWLTSAAAVAAPLDDETATHPDASSQTPGYRWRGPAAHLPDWRGVRRDTAYFLGYQFAAVAILYVAPEQISGWDSETKDEYSLSKWRENVSNPVWKDGDAWWINYLTHPYWGGAYYIRARERGLDRTQAFWYSALLSTLFEYGPEALFEPVSLQDLVITPVVGSLVGEYLFTPLRQRIRAKPGALDWSDKALLFITDPLGVLNSATDRLFGVKTTLQFQPIGPGLPLLSSELESHRAATPVQLRRSAPAWGLTLRLEW